MLGAPSFPIGAPNKRRSSFPGRIFTPPIPGKGLVGWWEFGSSRITGTSVPDLSGSGNTGTLGAIATYISGKDRNRSGHVQGNSGTGSVTVGTNSSLNLTSTITISCWINPITFGANNRGRIFDRNNTTLGYGFSVLNNGSVTKGLSFYSNLFNTAGANLALSNANVITAGVWQHVVVTYDVGTTAVAFYVNGAAAGVTTLTSGIGSISSLTGRIGGTFQNSGSDFFGGIDSLRIYNRVLSTAEIRALYTTPNTNTIQPIDKIWAQISPSYIFAAVTDQTLANITSSSAGTVLVTGTATPTFPAVTSASTGTVLVTGTVSSTLGNLTSSSAGTVLVTGSLSSTIDNLTVSSTATGQASATLTATIGALTSSSAGTVLVTCTTSATVDPLTSSSAGTVLVKGTLGATIDNLTVSSTGTVIASGAPIGTLSATFPAITSSSAGTVRVTGSATPTIDPITSSSLGAVLDTGTLSSTIAAITAASTGTVLVSGTLSKTLPNLTSTATGSAFTPVVLNATIPAITSVSAGKVRVTGSSAATIANLTVSSTGKVLVKGSLTATIGPFRLHTRVVNPFDGSSDRSYLTIPRFNIDHAPSGEDLTGHLLEKLRQQQQWLDALSDAVPQSANKPPVSPRYGTMRYAAGAWATTLGSTGLYIYTETGWVKII